MIIINLAHSRTIGTRYTLLFILPMNLDTTSRPTSHLGLQVLGATEASDVVIYTQTRLKHYITLELASNPASYRVQEYDVHR